MNFQNIYAFILLISLFLGIPFAIFLYIRKLYLEYDRRETMKEEIEDYRAKIKEGLEFIRLNYDNPIYFNLKTRTNFSLKLIGNKNTEDQLKEMKYLYEMLFETQTRLKTNYIDVGYIMAPLKNLTERLFEEQMDYIREMSEKDDEGLE